MSVASNGRKFINAYIYIYICMVVFINEQHKYVIIFVSGGVYLPEKVSGCMLQ